MKVALVHDYLREFGGAERVLDVLSGLWPDAPIYTAFAVRNSVVGRHFASRTVIESRFAPLLKIGRLYSPLRFLTPAIWRSFDLRQFDVVITSASWYITRGFRVGPKTKVICYCHTPPRWLYGYPTGSEWQRFWPVQAYGQLLAHALRQYDYRTAQEVDVFLANSENVRRRIAKFYRREAQVVYPPVAVESISRLAQGVPVEDYYLIVSRLVGSKGIELALQAAAQGGFRLKVVGEGKDLPKLRRANAARLGKVEFLGRLTDLQLARTYAGCRAFLALAEDEDFGMTPVEAMAAGRPVIAFRGGGYLEVVAEEQTGLFFNEHQPASLLAVIEKFENRRDNFLPAVCLSQAKKFSRLRFEKAMTACVRDLVKRRSNA